MIIYEKKKGNKKEESKEKDMRNIESDCRQESLSAKTRIFANMRSCLHPKTVLKFRGISSSKFRMLTK